MNQPVWHTDAFPELRPGPPWAMQEMMSAEPELVATLLSQPPAAVAAAAEMIARAVADGRPVTVCGCGTSEHAAHGIADLIASALMPPQPELVRTRAAFTAAQDPVDGVCVAVSHDGGTRATTLALEAAGAAGAQTVAITNQAQSSVAHAADAVIVTPVHDESWCHTVAYTSALAVGAAIAVGVGSFTADGAAAADVLQRALQQPEATAIAERLADRRVILCAAPQADLATARELALKIAEATHVPAFAFELETLLHGQLAAAEPADALILVALSDTGDTARTGRRAGHVARAAATIGLRVAALLSPAHDQTLDGALTPDGRLVAPPGDDERLDPRLTSLLGGAGMLQTLTLELAHARRVNPDLIRREQSEYREAAAAAESTDDW